MSETIRIAMWSGPRNLSTAMMRSFSSRADTFVSDEPFYGAYLKTTRDPQPMIDEIIADMDCDWESVKNAQNGDAPDGSAIWYQKHMPHHMEGPVSILDFPETRHAFLIRDPIRVAASYANKRTEIRPEHLGITRQRAYFELLADKAGQAPPVIDSYDILLDPAKSLKNLCQALGIPWDTAMLSWERGPHKQDGIWGSHWYDKVNASTGFGKPPGAMPQLDADFQDVAEECRDDYEFLTRFAIKGD
ncbi:HAD family hydrolase [Erythrobacter sp. SCSIO 43205]|uniref:sulfotransferase n=1 Tax=Erythrobacter sp. SCSIO 43205 TaxID=2779361 RepID=UPI001CA8B651|nr:sulfotransferase [Erythrobacter sp. SCSIO 43205]UAB77171.1 HAD family hydrolase [Erythrobacter sp. SCSIO 43205]